MTIRDSQPTAKPADQSASTTTTVRVGSSQLAGNGEMTVRPGTKTQDQSGGDVEFFLKGRVYRSIKCLSDNSGEAQVFWLKVKKGSVC